MSKVAGALAFMALSPVYYEFGRFLFWHGGVLYGSFDGNKWDTDFSNSLWYWEC